MARLRLSLVPFALLFCACASTTSLIPRTWMSVPEAPRVRALALDEKGVVSVSATPPANGPIHVGNGSIMNGPKALTESFAAIDSFAFSPSRGEVVFSAKRKDNFDVGLVSSDGSPIVWIPSPDPSDEIGVQWAPRGNKISYIVRAKGGDVVRTVHVPTSFQVATDFPGGTIHALAWDPQAEHYAVSYATLDASDRVEIVKYDGSTRKIVTPPAVTVDAEVEPFSKDAMLLRPRDIAYDEHLPLVVWVADDFDWNDARAALMKNARVAVVVTRQDPTDELWAAMKDHPWIDATRVFLVNAGNPVAPTSAVVIAPDATLPPGRYRRAGNVVSVPPAVIQSFSAGFIADEVKRTPPAHGST